MKSSSTIIVNGSSEMDALLSRQQELLAQLRVLILPALRYVDGRSADLAIGLFNNVSNCVAGVIHLVNIYVISPNAGEGQEEKPMISNIGQKRRATTDAPIQNGIAQQPRKFSNWIKTDILTMKRKLQNVDVPALIEVLDNPELNWNIIY
ncbi:hypothetical protein VPH35_034149 [Triticum aestivum]